MLADSGASGLFSYAELNYLRLEAMDLFERCLTEGKPDFLESFIEQQISQDPPRLELLRDVAEDLHQRLMGLREYHFDVRDKILRTVQESFGVDISPLIPANALESFHLLDSVDALAYLCQRNPCLSEQDKLLLRKMLDSSLSMASQLYSDMLMTQYLHDYVMDWVMGLNALLMRRFWTADERGRAAWNRIIH